MEDAMSDRVDAERIISVNAIQLGETAVAARRSELERMPRVYTRRGRAGYKGAVETFDPQHPHIRFVQHPAADGEPEPEPETKQADPPETKERRPRRTKRRVAGDE